MDRLGWAASSTFQIGSYLLGIRTDSYPLDTRMRAVLDAHLADVITPYSNYSVRLDDPEGPATPLKKLYRGGSLELASRSERRIVRALLRHLSSWALAGREDLLEVRAVAAVGDGRAVLLPAEFGGHSPPLERRLASVGFGLIDAPLAHLDAVTGELVVGPLALQIDWGPLVVLDEAEPRPTREGPEIRSGRYPISCWAFAGGQSPSSRAEAALRAVELVSPRSGAACRPLVDVLTAALSSARTLVVEERPAAAADAVVGSLG